MFAVQADEMSLLTSCRVQSNYKKIKAEVIPVHNITKNKYVLLYIKDMLVCIFIESKRFSI